MVLLSSSYSNNPFLIPLYSLAVSFTIERKFFSDRFFCPLPAIFCLLLTALVGFPSRVRHRGHDPSSKTMMPSTLVRGCFYPSLNSRLGPCLNDQESSSILGSVISWLVVFKLPIFRTSTGPSLLWWSFVAFSTKPISKFFYVVFANRS